MHTAQLPRMLSMTLEKLQTFGNRVPTLCTSNVVRVQSKKPRNCQPNIIRNSNLHNTGILQNCKFSPFNFIKAEYKTLDKVRLSREAEVTGSGNWKVSLTMFVLLLEELDQLLPLRWADLPGFDGDRIAVIRRWLCTTRINSNLTY